MKQWMWAVVCGLLATWLAGCGGGGNDSATPAAPVTALSMGTAGSVSLLPAEFRSLGITGGRKPYKVESADTGVVLAAVTDSTLSLAAIKSSLVPVNVVLTDAQMNKLTLAVSVGNHASLGDFVLSPARLAVVPGGVGLVSLQAGTPPFTAVPVSQGWVSAAVTDRSLTITGLLEVAETTVRITDSLGATRDLPVSVAAAASAGAGVALFTNLTSQTSLLPGTSKAFTVAGGTGPYTVTSSRPGVLAASVNGQTLRLHAGVAGSALVTVSDVLGAQVGHTVAVQGTPPPLALSSTALFGPVGTTASVTIVGGRPPYGMYGDASGVAAGSVTGNVLSLALMAPGNGVVTVLDADFNTVTTTVVATGTAAPTKFTLSPTKLLIPEALALDAAGKPQQTVIALKLYKAEPPVQVFSSAPALLKPTLNGSTVEVRTPGTAASPVPPCVDADTIVTITVLDAAGNTASTEITIRNGGACTAS